MEPSRPTDGALRREVARPGAGPGGRCAAASWIAVAIAVTAAIRLSMTTMSPAPPRPAAHACPYLAAHAQCPYLAAHARCPYLAAHARCPYLAAHARCPYLAAHAQCPYLAAHGRGHGPAPVAPAGWRGPRDHHDRLRVDHRIHRWHHPPPAPAAPRCIAVGDEADVQLCDGAR